jgi:hypothetical protein
MEEELTMHCVSYLMSQIWLNILKAYAMLDILYLPTYLRRDLARETEEKPSVWMSLLPPQIPRDLTWVQTLSATVGGRLTACAMARPLTYWMFINYYFHESHIIQYLYIGGRKHVFHIQESLRPEKFCNHCVTHATDQPSISHWRP